MSDYIVEAIKNGVFETLKMTAYASLYAYIVGLPLGVILYATASGRLLANRPVNVIIGAIVDIMRSLPFLILLVLLIPFTRFVTGSSIGTTAAIVPLTVGAIPIVARMVEASLCEVQPGIIEAATSMGASPLHIIIHFILPEAAPSLGLGAIALQYGYYRYQKDVLWTTVILLVIMVMVIQQTGGLLAKFRRKS